MRTTLALWLTGLGATAAPSPLPVSVFESVLLDEGVSLELAWVPPGSFLKGSARDADEVVERFGGRASFLVGEHPQQPVRVDQGFHLGVTEVTVGQFGAFAEATGYRTTAERQGFGFRSSPRGGWERVEGLSWRNPDQESHPDQAVSFVTQEDGRAFCAWLTEHSGRRFRLPRGDEWEYACGGGKTTAFGVGDDATSLDRHAWYSNRSRGRVGPREVALLEPGPHGLFDMHGNVWEWCEDVDSKNPGQGLLKGGSYLNGLFMLRTAYGPFDNADLVEPHLGFRVLGEVSSPSPALLDDLVPELLEQHRVPGAAVALVQGGRVIWAAGYGWADVRKRRPVTPETIFNAGSISKTVTAWGVMRLVEQGKIDLDEPLQETLTRWRFPRPDQDASGVTPRRLLSHTAGLTMPSVPGFRVPAALPSLEDTLSGKYRRSVYTSGGTPVELEGEPGTRWSYSGGGYVLLQLLVEERAGEEFSSYMQRHVLDPLGMIDSRFGWDEELAERAARPHRDNGALHPTYRFTGTAGAGLYTTVVDLARFGAAALEAPGARPGRGVLEPETVTAMMEPVTLKSGEAVRSGLGYFVTPEGVVPREAQHSGSNHGWKALMLSLPDEGLALAILINSDRGNPLLNALACAWGEAETGTALSGCQ